MQMLRACKLIILISLFSSVNFQTGHCGPSFTGRFLGFVEVNKGFRPQKIQYVLFTRSNTTSGGVKITRKHPLRSGFNVKKKTVVLIHGSAGSGRSTTMLQLKDAILKTHDVNVISFNWSFYAQKSFRAIIKHYKVIGFGLGEFLTDLHNKTEYELDNVHIIGHSVGVHIAGFAGRSTRGKIHRVTGLDPSDLRNIMKSRTDFILPTDAEHVDCIRTSTFMGLRSPVCQCDFYANDGISQKGCTSGLCDHFASTSYYINSLSNPFRYPAQKCKKVRNKTIEGCATKYTAYAGQLGGNPCKPGVYKFKAAITMNDARVIYIEELEAGTLLVAKKTSKVAKSNASKNGVKMKRKHPLRSGFKPQKKTIVLVHGSAGSAKEATMLHIKDAILKVQDANVISCDWSKYSQKSFKSIIKHYKVIGYELGEFLIDLHNKTGHDYTKIHIIGHSVGAHVAGFAGRHVPGKIHRVTGLDPSDLRNLMESRTDFILPNDAKHVDCVHTSTSMGLRDPVCACDFYANIGITQKGCGSAVCDHFASTRYYVKSVSNPKKYPARKCEKVEEKSLEECSANYTAFFGHLGGTLCNPGVYQFNAVITRKDATIIYSDEKELGKTVAREKSSQIASNMVPFGNSTILGNLGRIKNGNLANVVNSTISRALEKVIFADIFVTNSSDSVDNKRTEGAFNADKKLSMALGNPTVF